MLGLNPNGLGIVKSLRKAGIRVIGIDRSPRGSADTHTWMSSRTRLCERRLVGPNSRHETLLEALLEIAETHSPTSLPVLPSGDNFLIFLSKHRSELSGFRFHMPEPSVLDLLLKKGNFFGFCAREGIPVPATAVGVGTENLREALGGLRSPFLIKPEIRDSRWDEMYAPVKALVAKDEDELRLLIQEASKTGAELIVQEIIPGSDSELYFSHGFFSPEGDTLALWTGRKLRQYPPRFGTSTLTESVWVPEVAVITERIAKALSLRGYVNVEFKYDARDRSYRLIEVTPSRTWYPHYLGTSLGINIPELWYQDLMGMELPSRVRPQTHRRYAWVDEYRDLVGAYELWRDGQLRLRDWVKSYSRVRSFALLSPWDPVPGLRVGVRLVEGIFNRGMRRMSFFS